MEHETFYDGFVDASDASTAALSVGVLVVVCGLFLVTLRKSGFRAMVAVGR